MLPVLNLWGLALGKWWRVVVPLGGVYWAWVIVSDGIMEPTARNVFVLFLLGAANTAAGALLNRGLAWIGRRLPDEGRWPRAK